VLLLMPFSLWQSARSIFLSPFFRPPGEKR
jgi:hypothetical protein